MIVRMFIQTIIWFGAMALVLFLSAGTIHWTASWIFLIEMVTLALGSGLLLARHDPGLLAERLAPPIQKEQPAADKVLIGVIFLILFGSLAIMGLDAVRFRWSVMPVWMQAFGALLLLVSVWFGYRILRENSFAAPVVKLQKERGQTVISTGPYRYVRHPFYTNALLYLIGTSLLLGSWWGLTGVFALALLLAIRIQVEETTLRNGLEGYADYARHIRYRLVPFVW